MKKRLDQLLVERGLVQSRERAQRLILAGQVLVDDTPITKAGMSISVDSEIRLKIPDHPYVSRGALKLKKALEEFNVQIKGGVSLDIGASTGGFTEILLEAGIEKAHCVDVGTNQLNYKIRKHERVIVHEQTNARMMDFAVIGEKVDIIVMDVSFISITKIAPNLLQFFKPETQFITLIKPQFEVGPDKVAKGGIVVSSQYRQEAIDQVCESLESLGLKRKGLVESPITGTDGNQEYLAIWTKN